MCRFELAVAKNILGSRLIWSMDYDLVANHVGLVVVKLHYGAAWIVLGCLQQILPLHGMARPDPHDRQQGRGQINLAAHLVVKTWLDV